VTPRYSVSKSGKADVRTRVFLLIFTVCIAMAIGILALTPATQLPEFPGGDKLHHLLAFAVLVFPVAAGSPRDLAWLLPMALLYGGIIEVVQPWVNRWGEWGDFGADSAGIILGTCLGGVVYLSCKFLGRTKPCSVSGRDQS
jgi:hypothetical protein